jgi:hypothetical protein
MDIFPPRGVVYLVISSCIMYVNIVVILILTSLNLTYNNNLWNHLVNFGGLEW